VYSLFPAFAADLYGTAHVSATYGLLYTGKVRAPPPPHCELLVVIYHDALSTS
jgi:hypothetical protein